MDINSMLIWFTKAMKNKENHKSVIDLDTLPRWPQPENEITNPNDKCRWIPSKKQCPWTMIVVSKYYLTFALLACSLY